MKNDDQIREAAEHYAANHIKQANNPDPNGIDPILQALIKATYFEVYKQALSDMQQERKEVNLEEVRLKFSNYFMKGISSSTTAKLKYGTSQKDLFNFFLSFIHEPAPESDAADFVDWIFKEERSNNLWNSDENEKWIYFKTAHGKKMTSEELYNYWKLNHKQQ